MKRLSFSSILTLGLCSLVTVAGCGGESSDNTQPTTPGPVTPSGQCISELTTEGNLLLRAVDGNNYSLVNNMTIQRTEIAPGTGLTIDWSALKTDFFKHPITAGIDYNNVTVALFEFKYDELKTRLEHDDLGGAATVGLTFPVDGTVTSVKVTDMLMPYTGLQKPEEEQVATYFDPTQANPAVYSYTITVNSGDVLKSGVKMIHYAELNPASTNTLVSLTDNSATLVATANIASKPAISIPAATNTITVDWNDMVNNAVGQPFLDGSISDVRVLHFPYSAAELETKVLDLELIYDQEYKGVATGVERESLSTLRNAQGQPFPGIDPALGGTWMLALMCRSDICGSPAPWFFARLEACQ